MPHKDYYEVPLGAYLFEHPESEEAIKPEERVRQWCAHELIRAYGFPINDISFEHKVRYGSSIRRIDILILNEGKPHIVVECKRREFKGGKKGLEQAINYASAETIKAEYAIYTNGSDWMVNRCVNGLWTSVEGVPSRDTLTAEFTADQLYMDLHQASPLIHRLGTKLEGKEAKIYLDAMQRFFSGSNLLTRHGDGKLRSSLDNLLRSIIHFNDPHYCRDKFLASYALLLKYGKSIGAGWISNAPLANEHPFRYTAIYQDDLKQILADIKRPTGMDYYLLQLISSLYAYSQEFLALKKVRKHLPLTHGIHQNLRDLLDTGFKLELHHTIPDLDDSLYLPEIQRETAYKWESLL